MSNSLSLILPVHNTDRTLKVRVGQLLEMMVDLTEAVFDLWIIDDGSRDQTMDVAMQLAKRYPQVNLLRCSTAEGWPSAVRRGIAASGGEIVLVCNATAPLKPQEFAQLWQLRHDQELVLARYQCDRPSRELLELIWPEPGGARGVGPVPEMPRGMVLLRRTALKELASERGHSERREMVIDRVTRTDMREKTVRPPAAAGSAPWPSTAAQLSEHYFS